MITKNLIKTVKKIGYDKKNFKNAVKLFAVIALLSSVFMTASCNFDNNFSVVDGFVGGEPLPEISDIGIRDRKRVSYHIYGYKKSLGDDYLYFPKGYFDVPYISLSSLKLISKIFFGIDYKISSIENGFKIEYKNTSVILDCSTQKITFDDYDEFFGYVGTAKYCGVNISASANNKSPVTFDLGKYGIKMVKKFGELYLPQQIASYIFYLPYQVTFVYNGIDVTLIDNSFSVNLDSSFYYSFGVQKERSKVLNEFNYRAMCFLFDNFFGLKNNTSNYQTYYPKTDFNEYVNNNGKLRALGIDMFSSDPKVADKALATLLNYVIDDGGHTGFVSPSRYQKETEISEFIQNQQYDKRINRGFKIYYGLLEARNLADSPTQEKLDAWLTKNALVIDEDSKTAFITFDSFIYNNSFWMTEDGEDRIKKLDGALTDSIVGQFNKYSSYDKAKDFVNADTVIFIVKALYEIAQYNSTPAGNKIRNIVIDESCNGGGSDVACEAAVAFLKYAVSKTSYTKHKANNTSGAYYDISISLGDSAQYEFTKMTLKETTKTLDEWFTDCHFYVLTSGFSFSNANAFACMIKESCPKIKIIGQKSGGGSCNVVTTSLPDSTVFSFSTSTEYVKKLADGSYADIDDGAEPDFEIPYEKFYTNENGKITRSALVQTLKEKYPSNF